MSQKLEITLQHPFIDGLKNIPHDRVKELKKIRSWMNSQPHLPYISDEYIYLFLHACFYHYDKTKHAIETYFTVRANSPAIFSNKDVYNEKLQNMLQMIDMASMPKTTPEGYKILMYVIKDADPSIFYFSEAIKGFCMYNDCRLSEDGLEEGYIVIFDMKYVKLGHLARVSLPSLRAFMVYIQEAHPARLKAIHVVNTATWIHHIMRIVQPMIRTDIVGLLRFHKGDVPEGVPQELLPIEYGGQAPSIKELAKEVQELIGKYARWLRETENFVADESKRVKKSSWWSLFNGSTGNENAFNTTELPATFRNLQID
ncbi:hypothetical protein ILUMI_24702 [Ignelater luminosus]|uniref:CRAL-TRIO domain-containing protein n=1 Tax=Ignelater luminosus TaxID=2038154 RepID=A0A8K0C9Q6_IGNLU|nr:hypothetical protein ILUMI_24702 [Ignelater luminosus]